MKMEDEIFTMSMFATEKDLWKAKSEYYERLYKNTITAETTDSAMVKNAKDKMESFSARGSKCPICKKEFRKGCNHSVKEAKDKLQENYITAITRKELGKMP